MSDFWNKTKEASEEAWKATKQSTSKAWNKTKEVFEKDGDIKTKDNNDGIVIEEDEIIFAPQENDNEKHPLNNKNKENHCSCHNPTN